MGSPREPKPAKYFVALLSSDSDLLDIAEMDLSSIVGKVEGRSETVPWAVSTFYEKEMGPGLLRRFVSFANLRAPGDLAALKVQTNRIEDNYRIDDFRRRVNVDPGYLDAYKVVLASTKNAGQRVYLGSGIYGEATLMYHDGAFHGLEYTYRDYLWPETLRFLIRLRAVYLAQLRELG
ncbi:MAG TPA: DUF4416 family protein [Candidatus Binatia bacterium]|nr:DUF4416 family protein [Candidatus Binatia bacterium]